MKNGPLKIDAKGLTEHWVFCRQGGGRNAFVVLDANGEECATFWDTMDDAAARAKALCDELNRHAGILPISAKLINP